MLNVNNVLKYHHSVIFQIYRRPLSVNSKHYQLREPISRVSVTYSVYGFEPFTQQKLIEFRAAI